MLISLITLRLEIAHDVPDLKFFKCFTAAKRSGKTYASVTRSGISPQAQQASHKDIKKGGHHHQPSDPHKGNFSESPRNTDSDSQLTNTEDVSQSSVNESSDQETKFEELDKNCRGQRQPGVIHIELIEEEVIQHLVMEAQAAEGQQKGHLEDEASTSKEGQDLSQEQGCSTDEPSSRHRETELGTEDAPTPSQNSTVRPKSHSPVTKVPNTINFFSGNPSVELTKGILHLYKDCHMTTLDKDVSRSEMLCMLAIPASYTIHDLIKFVAPMGDFVSYMQVLRDSFPNQYMLLIKFRDQESADDFYSYFNNRPFNSIEPDICHLVYVAKVEIVSESEGGSVPLMDLTELPNCPVCLERMEESVDGILTILCNHAFHTHCLAQWGDTSCPVCRYCQTPEAVADQRCMQCGSHESLWICLICGTVGCGRYVGLHAYKHFQETNHTYAMQLGTNRVWDYAGDNYVHRLAQNKSDGKLVEVDEGGNVLREEKLDSITLEYTYLLTSQLESQRLYFMEQITEAVKEVEAKLLESTERWDNERQEREKAECKLAEVCKEKLNLDRRYNQLHSRSTKALSELQEERQMNKCLRENQQDWQLRVSSLEQEVKVLTEKKDKEITELQEQLRDVMFYLEAQQKLASSPGVSQQEIQDGQVILGAAATPTGGSGKKGRKKPQR